MSDNEYSSNMIEDYLQQEDLDRSSRSSSVSNCEEGHGTFECIQIRNMVAY